MKNNDKTAMSALVTGASSGIGLEFTRQLAARGCDILMVSNEADALAATVSELSGSYPQRRFMTCCLDLTTPSCATTLIDYCHTHDLTIDILINDAGIFSFQEICDMSEDRLNSFIDLHVRAVTHISRAFAVEMKQRHYGYILNMSSMACWMPMPGIGMYAATKAYIRVFSRTLQLELKESNVSVTVACPGGIATDLFGLSPKLQRLAVKLGVLVTPRKFVKGALRHMFHRRKQYINGWLNRLSIFIVATLPTRVRLIVKHRLLDKKENT
jgi:short-subunit dehydrogenase